jgi:outer membrane protein OmpA-like peptidoglycan-associated protein
MRARGHRRSTPRSTVRAEPRRRTTPSKVLAQQLPRALGNQAVAQFVKRGLDLPSPADPREREASAVARNRDRAAAPEQPAPDVRLHTDERAAQMADALDSRAFTLGHDIFFGAGQFDPASERGRELIDHEMVHAYLHDDPQSPALLRQPVPGAPTEERTDRLSLTPDVPPPSVIRSDGATLATVYFGQGDFLLGDPRSIRLLERLAEDLRFFVDPVINVEGHASGEGSDAVNLALSENRRQAVIALLSARLTTPATFGGSAHGEADPAEPETSTGADLERQRARNRRVEIFIAPRMPVTATPPPPTPIDLRPRFEPRPETDEERLNRILREPPPTRPPDISIAEAAGRRFDEAVDSLLRRTNLSREWRERIRDAARSVASGAAERAIDAAVDASPLGSEERDALKAAIRAALRTPSLPQ